LVSQKQIIMIDFFEQVSQKKISLPADVVNLLMSCKKLTVYDTVDQLETDAVGGGNRYHMKSVTRFPGKEKLPRP
jgi:hypothetical protein